MNDNQPTAAVAAPEELHALKTMKALREGEFIQELDDALQDAINIATDLGKPATVTVKLTITPAGRTVVIDDNINSKLPDPVKDSTIFFLDKNNLLSTKDPKQATFPADAGFVKGAAAANG